jgi:hypothetical protein
VLLLPLSLAMYNGEFDNGGSSGRPAAAAVVATAAAVAAVDNRNDIQWCHWWGRFMAVAAMVATFNGSGV